MDIQVSKIMRVRTNESRSKKVIFCILMFCFCFVMISWFMTGTTVNAQIYQWTDEEGNDHISDTPPDDETLQKSLKIIGLETEYLVQGRRINRMIYQDDVFKIVLKDETYDRLTFELTYKNIEKAFPGILKMDTTIFICAGNDDRDKFTYLSYNTPKVTENNNTLILVNKMSDRSPSDIKTTHLSILLYRSYRNAQGKANGRNLFYKQIPFNKIWAKFS